MARATTLATAVLAAAISPLLAQRAAHAEPPGAKATPLYVLSIWTNDSDDQADALTQALRTRVRQTPGWSLAETNQSFETLAIALRCPPTPDALCLDRIGDQLHTDHYVWGTLAKEKPGEVTADLRLWSRGKPQVEASESYPESAKDPNDPSLREVAARLLGRLTSAGDGTLVVHAGSGSGTVLVDGAKKAALEDGLARVQVARGTHTVVVRVSGFEAAEQTTEVKGGSTQDLSFSLTPAGTEPEPTESAGTGGVSARKVVGYSAIVAGVGLVAAAVVEGVSWLNDKSASDSDRASVPANVTDVCAQPVNPAALDACQKSKDATTASTFGWIFAGAGAVLTGTGIWLVATGHAADAGAREASRTLRRPRFEVVPAVSTRGGALDVVLTF